MTRVLALAGQSKIGLSRSGGSPKPGPKPIRNGVPLWTETACRFTPKPPAGLNRNRLSETPKYAQGIAHSPQLRRQRLVEAQRFLRDRSGSLLLRSKPHVCREVCFIPIAPRRGACALRS